MPGPQRISAETFAVEMLEHEPDLDYATLRERAREAGVSLQPIHYGRARKKLGLPALRDSRPEPVRRNAAVAPAAEVRDDAEAADEPHADEPTADEPTEPVAPRRKGSAAFDFLVQELRRDPGLAYGDLRRGAEAKGWKIAPIMYGRAKAVLGLVPVKPRGSKKAAAAAKANAVAAPLQLKQVESVAADRFAQKLGEVRSLEQLVAIVKELDGERRRLRDVLERVITMLDEALG